MRGGSWGDVKKFGKKELWFSKFWEDWVKWGLVWDCGGDVGLSCGVDCFWGVMWVGWI
tara:strand:+ start:896 stop:1069 length:174 start_codon:yes stop_codon:yes gene_type:complete